MLKGSKGLFYKIFGTEELLNYLQRKNWINKIRTLIILEQKLKYIYKMILYNIYIKINLNL